MNPKTDSAPPGLYLFDRILIGYCLLMVLLIGVWGRPFSAYLNSLLFYAGMATVAALIVRCVDPARNRWLAFVRLAYPAVMFTFFYWQTGRLMFLFFDSFFDWQLVTFEHMIFGGDLSLYIDRNLLNVWLTEVLSFCYFAYYPMLPAFVLAVFWKRDDNVLKEFLAVTCLTFFASYLLFALYPAEGPRWHFAHQYVNTVDGPFFRQLVNLVISEGAVHGGAMPSSHTGVAFIVMAFCFRYYRRCGWILLPIVCGLAAGTVWGRFHYVTDVIVGLAIAVVALLWVWSRSRVTEHMGTTSANSRRQQSPSAR
jgi:membrane-associated phospholipid phosphatase